MLFAVDTVLVVESLEEVNNRLEKWRVAFKNKTCKY